ncbi:hypothetical protein NQ315_009244 [Exocentrus adspersus]|uniref:Reverse transcriptase domain-containing protein n=1 Tax=Exocentrus adspersus TaxID=1586481 RepID=A0AAV8WFQ3_9CUCU|nr:hypothetical protein NQ315_009244 [Exocentrus adspersus]
MNSTNYQQEFGVAMGSPLSPVVSNIFMEDFEKRDINSYNLKPSLWVRYVDGMFIVWPHGRDTIESFLQHLNSIEESIKFTMETKKDGKLAFLECPRRKDQWIQPTRPPSCTLLKDIQEPLEINIPFLINILSSPKSIKD